jgi:hypothetical protein
MNRKDFCDRKLYFSFYQRQLLKMASTDPEIGIARFVCD